MRHLGVSRSIHTEDEADWSMDVHTTYRDPREVAATWANRFGGPLDEHSHDVWGVWQRAWTRWADNLHRMTLHRLEDIPLHENKTGSDIGVRAALNTGGLDEYRRFVPDRYIEFAESVWPN